MKKIDSVKAVLGAIAILSMFVLIFSTTVFTLSKTNEYIIVNNTLKESENNTKPISVAEATLAKVVEENKTEVIEKVDIALAKSEADKKREALEARKQEVVYENITLGQLADQLDRNLNSTLAGQGLTFATYAVDLGIDPYLAVAIVLHETGCKWSCSGAVNNYYNVGGMMGNGGLLHFNSLEEGIDAYMHNLYNNYVSKGLTTADSMASKYAASPTWASNVNSYINQIKAS